MATLSEDDWDTEEFQTALKIVLKYEIQSLLERLSYHGEETVLLTANTDENSVSHLASSNAQKFVDSKDVGDLKSKFLSFLIGSDQQATLRQMVPAVANRGLTANVQSGTPAQRKYSGAATARPTTGVRVGAHDAGASSDSEMMSQRLDNIKSVSGQQGKPGAKRPIEDTVISKDKLSAQPLSPKRRKVDNVGNQAQATALLKQQKPSVSGVKAGNKPSETLPQFTALRASQQIQQKSDIKLSTTKVVSKSGFVEERISQAQFQQMLQQYNTTHMGEMEDYDEEEEEEEEEDCDDEEEEDYGEMLEEGEIPFPYMEAQHTQKYTQAGQQHLATATKPAATVAKPGNAIVSVNASLASKASGKTLESESGKKVQTSAVSKAANSAVLATGIKTVAGTSGKKTSDDSKVPDTRDGKELDGNTKDNKKASEQSQVKGAKDSLQKDSDKDKSVGSAGKDGNTTVPASGKQNSKFSNVDDMDTESLIKMVKEQHAKSQSDADKQIQQKLGQLSSKLSWVVEYPKDSTAAEQQKIAMHRQMFPPGMANFPPDFLEDEDEEEEEFNEEDFDEEELDEQDRATLAQIRKMRELERASGERPGHFEGEIGDEEEFEDFDEMMEGFDQQHRLYDPAQNVEMPQYEGGENQDATFQPYQRSSSPSLDNFLLMGPSMAKCLVCNKIIRKTEIKQHNRSHEEEMGEEEEELEEEEGAGADDEFREEGAHDEVHDMGDCYDQTDDYHGEEDMGEAIDMADIAEFTAEPLVTGQLAPADTTPSKKTAADKPTVCDICDKSFVSYYNMIRHKRIHDGTRENHCPVCDKSFKLLAYLTKHLKKQHPDYVPGDGAVSGAGAVAGSGAGAPAGAPVGADGDGGPGAQDGGAEDGREKEKVQTTS